MSRCPAWQPEHVRVIAPIAGGQVVVLSIGGMMQDGYILDHQPLFLTPYEFDTGLGRTHTYKRNSRLSNGRSGPLERLGNGIRRLAALRMQDILRRHALGKQQEGERAVCVAWCGVLPISDRLGEIRCVRLSRCRPTSMMAKGRPALVLSDGKTVDMTPVGWSCRSRLVFAADGQTKNSLQDKAVHLQADEMGHDPSVPASPTVSRA
jgi:hypothetical protein